MLTVSENKDIWISHEISMGDHGLDNSWVVRRLSINAWKRKCGLR